VWSDPAHNIIRQTKGRCLAGRNIPSSRPTSCHRSAVCQQMTQKPHLHDGNARQQLLQFAQQALHFGAGRMVCGQPVRRLSVQLLQLPAASTPNQVCSRWWAARSRKFDMAPAHQERHQQGEIRDVPCVYWHIGDGSCVGLLGARQHLSGAKPAMASGLLASASSPACSSRFVVCIAKCHDQHDVQTWVGSVQQRASNTLISKLRQHQRGCSAGSPPRQDASSGSLARLTDVRNSRRP